MWVFLWCILLALTGPALAQPPGAGPRNVLSLEEAVHTALRDNRLVQNAALEVSKSERLVSAARTRRWRPSPGEGRPMCASCCTARSR